MSVDPTMSHLFHFHSALLLTAVTTFGLVVFMAVQHRNQALHRSFALYSLAIGTWAILQSSIALASAPDRSLLLARLMMLAVIPIPLLFLDFVAHLHVNLPHPCIWLFRNSCGLPSVQISISPAARLSASCLRIMHEITLTFSSSGIPAGRRLAGIPEEPTFFLQI